MKFWTGIFLIASALTLFAEETSVFLGDSFLPRMEKKEKIRLVSLEITGKALPSATPVDSSLKSFDVMIFHGKMVLSNTTDKPVTVNVGIPVSRNAGRVNLTDPTDKLISHFGIMVKMDGKPVSVKWIPPKNGVVFSGMFAWQMNFPGKKNVVLEFTEKSSGFFGRTTLKKDLGKREYRYHFLRYLEPAVRQNFRFVFYSPIPWVGPVDTGYFRIELADYESYLKKRGPFAQTQNEKDKIKNMRDEEIRISGVAERLKKQGADDEAIQKECDRITRCVIPQFDPVFFRAVTWGWHPMKDNPKVIEWTYKKWNVGGEMNFGYLFTKYPSTIQGFEQLASDLQILSDKEYESAQKMKKQRPEYFAKNGNHYYNVRPWTKESRRALASVLLHYNGIDAQYVEVKDFVSRQSWSGQGRPVSSDRKYIDFLKTESKPPVPPQQIKKP